MKKTIFILSLFAAACLAGCKSEKGTHNDGTVRFEAYQPDGDAGTKVTGTHFDANDEITVFAPLAGNPIYGNYDTHGMGPAKDRRYVADNNDRFTAKTEGDKIRYSSGTNKLDFYAVYPAMGPAPRCAIVDQTTYQIDLGDIADQRTAGAVVPYIYSDNAKAKGPGDGVVTLIFRNVFAKIALEVDYDPAEMGAGNTLSKVEFFADNGLYRECVIDLTKGGYDVVATNGGRNELATAADPYYFPAPAKGGNTTEGYIVPGRAMNPVIRLTFGSAPTIETDGPTSRPLVYLCRIPTGGSYLTFEAGKAYTYKITITNKVEVGIGGTIEDWVAAGGVPVIYAEKDE